ncbi:MAG: protein kinase [Planctomycetes bacterium]|nr:protein kinase [Planctomycetota bacterium]
MKSGLDFAVKVLRRRYAMAALHEIHVHHVTRPDGPCPEIATLTEGFLHDGHICLAFERHGRSLSKALRRAPLSLPRARRVTLQMLTALERLHRHGYAHTDVKPENILFDVRSGVARLADLGNGSNRLSQGSAPGTREYLAPEILLGAPLTVGIDIWSLGCTVFEMLSGRTLFAPRAAAERKYTEFAASAPEIELDPSVAEDEAVESAEQLSAGAVVGGRFQLARKLGQGRYGTVWSARRVAQLPPTPWPVIWEHARARAADEAHAVETERQRSDREWRRAKGADDVIDLALNFEHVCAMIALCGPLPPAMIESARFRASYFDPSGALRFDTKIRRAPLLGRLRRATNLGEGELSAASEFLSACLVLDPKERASAGALIEHPWLAVRGARGTRAAGARRRRS